MEKLRSQIILITMVTVISTVLLCVVPQGKMRSSFKILCALVVVYAIISPFASFDFDSLDFDSLFERSGISESFSGESEGAALIAANEGYAKAARDLLLKSGLKPEMIRAECSLKDNKIVLDELYVYCSFDDDEKQKSDETLLEIVNDDTEINYIYGEKDEKR